MSAVFCFSIMNGVTKYLSETYNVITLNMFRYWFFVLVIISINVRNKTNIIKISESSRKYIQFFRGSLLAVQMCFAHYCFLKLGLIETSAIFAIGPLFVTGLAIIFLNEIIGWRRWTAIIFGFTGVVIALDPSTNIEIASITALIATLMWSTTIIFLRILGETENPFKTVFYFMLVSVITTSFFQPYVWIDPTLDVYILLILLGVCAFITQSLMTFALQKAEASIVSPYNYTGIIWAIIIDLAIWNVYPLTNTIIGGIIITISGIYIFRRETKRSIKSSKKINI